MPWAGTAPPLAGLEGWTDQQAVKFLTTGIDKDGKNPRPPMPEYRFNRDDAASIVAYLRSLKQAAPAEKKEAAGQKPSGK
jgi:mono/diheme cytochrome c family protein